MAENRIDAVISKKVICKEPGRYIGWPTIAKTREGELLIAFSGDRDAHLCPWGKTEMVRSSDQGRTWTKPVTINDTPLDDRDVGIIQTKKGTLLVSWFTAAVFADNEYRWRKAYGDAVVDGWRERINSITDEERNRWLGHWVRRSPDGGKTWEKPVRTNGTSPHGPIELGDGRLLYVGKGSRDGRAMLTVEESQDDGCSWKLISDIPIPSEESMAHYHEPHVVELDSGKLVAMFRYNPPEMSQHFLRQSESANGGKTWSITDKTPIWGFPPHLIQLSNGWLLVAYGRRMAPFGERACISKDEGNTWDIENECVLSCSEVNDLGYPTSVQFSDGSILTVYYEIDKPGEKPCLMGTHWRLK